MTKQILVTGGAGFIGSHLVDALIAAGHAVTVVDNLSTGDRSNLDRAAHFEALDICSPEVPRLMTSTPFDVVYHLAAQIDLRQSLADPAADAAINIGGLLNVLDAARKTDVRQFVFASSAAVYGAQQIFPTDEETGVRPVSPYGVAKLAGEQYLYAYFCEYGLPATCLRYANVYGPRQNALGEAGVVAVFFRELCAGRCPTIFGDGKQTRDFIYVGDVVQANLRVMGQTGFHVYNIGTERETSVLDLFEGIRAAAQSKVNPLFAPAKRGDQPRSALSTMRYQKDFGSRFETPLSVGLQDTARWFQQ
jgi:UDP-glucose 4-epimerase